MIEPHRPHAATTNPWSRSLLIASVVAVICAGVLLARGLFDLQAARTERFTADAQLEHAQTMSDEIMTLAAKAPTASLGRRPTPGVVAQVGDALVLAGVPIEALTSLDADENAGDHSATIISAPGGESAVPGAAVRLNRQVNRLTLETVSMPQIASFLDAWRSNRPEWTITSIQISPQEGAARPTARARDPRPSGIARPFKTPPLLRVRLVMEAEYVDGVPGPLTESLSTSLSGATTPEIGPSTFPVQSK